MSNVTLHDEPHSHQHLPGFDATPDHIHGHTHTHTEGEEGASPAPFLLAYMLEHNMHHIKELQGLVTQLQDAGYPASAEAVLRALAHYVQGNAELAAAVEQL
ncbi:MAG: hypothetical protein LBJ48_06225 [Coriobacteriales bacterium]|nr:hypothetical protein [Coriobacteriales bacterium]